MRVSVQKWGNILALRIPKALAEDAREEDNPKAPDTRYEARKPTSGGRLRVPWGSRGLVVPFRINSRVSTGELKELSSCANFQTG